MKVIKHIRRDFHSVAWVMPQGSDLGVPGGGGGGLSGQKIFFLKFNHIWCVSYLHQWHMQRHNFFGPQPLGPWGGAKRSNIIKCHTQNQFPRFLNQTLCVFSQMKDIKHFRRDFHSVAWVMPKGWDLGVPWGVGGPNFFSPKFNQVCCMSYLHEWHMCNVTIFFAPACWGLGEGPKGQISLNLNFKDFKTKLCVFSQMKDIKHIRWDFHSDTWVMHAPGFGTWGCWGSKI